MSWNVKQRLPFALLLLLIVIKQSSSSWPSSLLRIGDQSRRRHPPPLLPVPRAPHTVRYRHPRPFFHVVHPSSSRPSPCPFSVHISLAYECWQLVRSDHVSSIKQWLSIKTDTVDVAILHFVNLLFDFLSIVVYTCQESNPCQNGGTCFEVKEGDVKTLTSHDESTPLPDDKTDKYLKFQCVCPYGYRGSLCQYRKLIISYQCMK